MQKMRLLAVAVLVAVLGVAPAARAEDTHKITVETDEFSRYITINGLIAEEKYPDVGARVWSIHSFVGKADHSVTHRIFFYDGYQSARKGYYAAVDETAEPLKVDKIKGHNIRCGRQACAHEELVSITISDLSLREHMGTGYRVKLYPKNGEACIITLTPTMISQQLAAVAEQGGVGAGE